MTAPKIPPTIADINESAMTTVFPIMLNIDQIFKLRYNATKSEMVVPARAPSFIVVMLAILPKITANTKVNAKQEKKMPIKLGLDFIKPL